MIRQVLVPVARSLPLATEVSRASEVTVLLPNNLPRGQDVWVTVTLRGQTSNRARIRIK